MFIESKSVFMNISMEPRCDFKLFSALLAENRQKSN